MKRLLIVALLLTSGCASEYRYHQTDDADDYNQTRRVVTNVTDTTRPAFSEPVMDYAAVTAVILAVVVVLGAMGAAE